MIPFSRAIDYNKEPMAITIAVIGSRGYPFVYSGYETLIEALAERLTDDGYKITVYCHRNLFPQRPKNVRGIHLVYLPTIEHKNFSQFFHSLQAMAHACVKRFSIVLVVNSANGPFGVLARFFRQKAVIHMDGLEWRRPKWRGLGAAYFRWASKMACRLYDVVLTDSREMQRIIEQEFRRRPEVIAYGADVRTAFRPEYLDKWHLSARGYYLIVGRLIPDNNADLMIREFLGTRSPRKLVIVGDVPYRDAYAERLKSLSDPRLVFTGYIRDRDELASLYAFCYAYLHGHEYGGTNPALLGALGFGAAVCALNSVFNREVLEDGAYGLLFNKAQGHLERLIQTIEGQPGRLDALRGKGPERIAAAYTWEKITTQYEALFERLVKTS